jgi:integrase
MVWLVNESRTQWQFGQRAGHPAPNAGRKYPAEPLTPAEVTAIIGQCSRRAPTGIRNRALLTLLYRSGLRVSEVLAVRPSDVDMNKHSIRLLGTKSGQAQTRGFHPSADDALARWTDTRKALGIGGHCKLFCTLAGTPLSDVSFVSRRGGRRFWLQVREPRMAASEHRRSRRFCQIVDEEYQKAIIAGLPAVPAEGPSSAVLVPEQRPPQSGTAVMKSGAALLLGAAGGAALGRFLWQKQAR